MKRERAWRSLTLLVREGGWGKQISPSPSYIQLRRLCGCAAHRRESRLDFCKVQLDERQVRLDFGQTPPLFRSLDDPGDGFPQDLA